MKKNKQHTPKIRYESDADVLMWELSKKNIYAAREMGDVIVHFTKNDTPVLIEILGASKFLSKANRIIRNASSPRVRKMLAFA